MGGPISVKNSDLKLGWLWWGLAVALLITVAWASLVPGPGVQVNDKWLHLVVYFGLSGTFSIIIVQRRSLLVIFVGLTLYGILLEYLQGLTTYRVTEITDAFANCLGIAIGLIVYFSPLYRIFRGIDTHLAKLVNR